MEEVCQHLQEMLDGGPIQPSTSPWCNTVLLVRKKDGTLRFCIDFRCLNDRTKKDAHPLPRMPKIMETMVGACIFSWMDLKSGFWQIKMAEELRQYMAFTVGSLGIYEFLQMPFGLCNAPATFQRLMQNCLGELNLTYALMYLDNVVVFSDTKEEHLKRPRAVLEHFQEHGLKQKPSKCNFFLTEISYLGHQLSAAGMRPGNNNVQGIAKMAAPMTFTGIRRYLGATGLYRRFFKGYTKIAKPLQDLISDDNSKLKKEEVQLTPEAIQEFQQLKVKCMMAPVLAFANFKKPFLLETDASGDGLGVVIQQKQDDGKYHPVAFTNWALKGGEKSYHSSKLEFLAWKWAVAEQFREYLLYQSLKARTDNNPLTYIMTTQNLDALGRWWVSALADFQMSIKYMQRADNKVADALSRIKDWLPPEAVKELIDFAYNITPVEQAKVDNPTLIAKEEALNHEVVIQSRVMMAKRQVPKQVSTEYWAKMQKQDVVIGHVRGWMLRSAEDKRTLSEYLVGKVPDDMRQAYSQRQQALVMSHNLLKLENNGPQCRRHHSSLCGPSYQETNYHRWLSLWF